MLWISFLLCHHETEVGPSGSLPTKPPICLVLCQLPTVTAQVFFYFIFEGVAGIARIKKKKSAVKSLRSSQKSLRLFAHL